jgi:hypothetical protein
MVAVAVLAICAVPMGEAIRNGIMASTVGADKARELRCMKNTMESILAEPYPTLWKAANGKDTAAGYALPDDPSCANVERSLRISLYEQSGSQPPAPLTSTLPSRRESALLFISLGSDKGYAFTTLVSR